jgi:hypothetical protein
LKRFIAWLFWPKAQISSLSETEHIVSILINILPILGVLFFEWDVFPILLLYCIESIIGIIFEYLKSNRENPDLPPGSPAFMANFLYLSLFIIGMIVPLTVIFLASNEELTLQSISNVFFLISVASFIGNQLIIQITNNKRIKKGTYKLHKHENQGYLLKLALLVPIAMVIALTGAYTISLISLIILKVFLEMRSFLRKRAVTT